MTKFKMAAAAILIFRFFSYESVVNRDNVIEFATFVGTGDL